MLHPTAWPSEALGMGYHLTRMYKRLSDMCTIKCIMQTGANTYQTYQVPNTSPSHSGFCFNSFRSHRRSLGCTKTLSPTLVRFTIHINSQTGTIPTPMFTWPFEINIPQVSAWICLHGLDSFRASCVWDHALSETPVHLSRLLPDLFEMSE